MLQGVTQDAGGFPMGVVEVGQLFDVRDGAAVGIQAVVSLQLPGEFVAEQIAAFRNERGETVRRCNKITCPTT